MAKEKSYIIDMFNGVPIGYVKSISYTKGKYTTTNDKSQARGYTTEYTIQKDIDELAKMASHLGHVFIYD